MKHLFLLLGFLASQGLYGQDAVVTNESLLVGSYSITNEMFAYVKSGNNPIHGITIVLKGEPAANGSTVMAAEINFFDAGDQRLNQKPAFDKNARQIVANYPVEAFPGILEMIKMKQKKKTLLSFNFSSDAQQNAVRAFFKLEEAN